MGSYRVLYAYWFTHTPIGANHALEGFYRVLQKDSGATGVERLWRTDFHDWVWIPHNTVDDVPMDEIFARTLFVYDRMTRMTPDEIAEEAGTHKNCRQGFGMPCPCPTCVKERAEWKDIRPELTTVRFVPDHLKDDHALYAQFIDRMCGGAPVWQWPPGRAPKMLLPQAWNFAREHTPDGAYLP